MTAPDKRARKKQHRDEIRAAREAALRRRRNVRLLGFLALLVVLVGGAIAFSKDDRTTPPGAQGGGQETPEPRPTVAACGAEVPPEPNPKTDYEEPEQVLEKGVDYSAVIETSCGSIEIDLLEERAPKNVNNFMFLAEEGFYDGLIWHRVEQNSVIQTGDPNGLNGTPPDDAGYTVPDELPKKSNEYVYGVVGAANSGPNTGSSQFFIVTQKNRPAGYQPFYSIFGEVTGGETDATKEEIGCDPEGKGLVPTLEAIGCQPTNTGASSATEAVKPLVPIFIESIEIEEA